MWEIDISIEGRKKIREGVRVEFDRLSERIDMANLKIKEEKEKPKADEKVIADLEKLVEVHSPEIKVLKGQMDAMDFDIDHEQSVIPATDLRKVIDAAEDMDKDRQKQIFKALDIISNQDKGGLIQRKAALLEYMKLVEELAEKL